MKNEATQNGYSENQDWNVDKTSEDIRNKKGIMRNRIRDCECYSDYHETRRWTDGRIRITKINSIGCEGHHIMLRPNGTYQIHDEGLHRTEVLGGLLYKIEEEWGIPIEERKGLSESKAKELQIALDEASKEEKKRRKDCMLEWDDRVYSFGGYY